MRYFFCLFLLLGTPLLAKSLPKAAPAPPAAAPMAPQRTVQQDLELRDWIVGIQTTAQDEMKRADAAEAEAKISREKATLAEAEAKASRDQSAISESKSLDAQKQLTEVQAKYNGVEDERNKAIAERDAEHKGRAAAEAHVSKIKTYLGFALGGLLAFAAFSLLSQFPLPPPLSFYVRIGGPVLAFGLGWLIVARFV